MLEQGSYHLQVICCPVISIDFHSGFAGVLSNHYHILPPWLGYPFTYRYEWHIWESKASHQRLWILQGSRRNLVSDYEIKVKTDNSSINIHAIQIKFLKPLIPAFLSDFSPPSSTLDFILIFWTPPNRTYVS